MTAENYVKQIVKKIQCDPKRKQDITKQLLAEIRERTDAGADLNAVLNEMGNVREIAEEFNEEISAEDRRRYRRNRRLKIALPILVVLAILTAAVVWWFPKSNDLAGSSYFDKDTVEQSLMNVISLLEAGSYDALQDLSTDSMSAVMSADSMESVKQSFGIDFGERTSVGTIYSAEIRQMGKHFAVCEVSVTYGAANVTYTVSFDENMKLAGLYMK